MRVCAEAPALQVSLHTEPDSLRNLILGLNFSAQREETHIDRRSPAGSAHGLSENGCGRYELRIGTVITRFLSINNIPLSGILIMQLNIITNTGGVKKKPRRI